MQILSVDEWWPRVIDHEREASTRTAGREARMRRGEPHAMEDFLYEYYPLRPRRFAKWYPGLSPDGPIALRRPPSEGPELTWWTTRGNDHWHEIVDDAVVLNASYCAHRAKGLRFQAKLQRRLLERPATFGCLGWHEWAMVYQATDRRHPLPLRLGQPETDRLVENAKIRCTHFDAFQFFTPSAKPLNEGQPRYENVPDMEQPGCIHVSMDLLRLCILFQPIFPGELAMEAYDLALRARRIDMAASPYDASALAIEPIRIETAAGKATYVRAQQQLASEAHTLREIITPLLEKAADESTLSAD